MNTNTSPATPESLTTLDCPRDISRLLRTIIYSSVIGGETDSSSSSSSSSLTSNGSIVRYIRKRLDFYARNNIQPSNAINDNELFRIIKNININSDHDPYTYRKLLTSLIELSQHHNNNQFCPLLPSLDILLSTEEHKSSYIFATSSRSQSQSSSHQRSSSTSQIQKQSTLHTNLYFTPDLLKSATPFIQNAAADSSTRMHGGPAGWVCLHCGKRFKTQYYVDLHVTNRHAGVDVIEGAGGSAEDGLDSASASASEDGLLATKGLIVSNVDDREAIGICPAALCPLVGCDDHSFEVLGYFESNYMRGDGKQGDSNYDGVRSWRDRVNVMGAIVDERTATASSSASSSRGQDVMKMKKKKKKKSCNENEMLKTHQSCITLFSSCFGGIDASLDSIFTPNNSNSNSNDKKTSTNDNDNDMLINELSTRFCNRLTCSNKLHSLAGKHQNHIDDEAALFNESATYNVGFFHYFVVVILVVFYSVVAVFVVKGRGRGREKGAAPNNKRRNKPSLVGNVFRGGDSSKGGKMY